MVEKISFESVIEPNNPYEKSDIGTNGVESDFGRNTLKPNIFGRDWHSEFSVKFGELVETGIWDGAGWGNKFRTKKMLKALEEKWGVLEDDIRSEINAYIADYFMFRDISTVPVGVWLKQFNTRIDMYVPSLLMLMLSDYDNDVDPYITDKKSDTGGEKTQQRFVHSDYPQSQISGGQDYATTADDMQQERDKENVTTSTGNMLKQYILFFENFEPAIKHFLDQLEPCFYQIFHVTSE